MAGEIRLIELVEALVKKPVAAIEQLRAGRNSRVYRAECTDGTRYAVKQYETAGTWDRLGTEYKALTWMARRGVAHVPKPIAQNKPNRVAVYSFIEGNPVTARIRKNDVAQAVALIEALAQFRPQDGAWKYSAAEGCRPFSQVADDIRKRAAALCVDEPSTCIRKKMRQFVESNVLELLNELAQSTPLMQETAIPLDSRVLSPSDFGFHNAIRRADESLVFVDFEYFGWDDPAKMTADFLLHPAMRLTEPQKDYFVRECYRTVPCPELLRQRLPMAFVVYGLKWCTILLNEFLPDGIARRRFSGDVRPEETILAEQYAKMKKMLYCIQNAVARFPYGH